MPEPPYDDANAASAEPLVADSFRRIRARIAAAGFGAVLALAGVGFFIRSQNAARIPALTPDVFDAARAAWRASPLPNYELEVEVVGPQPAVYSVVVENGVARSAQRNGQPLTQQRTLGTWSVDGMFGTIASDVAHLRAIADGSATHTVLHVDLAAEFDEEYGYPKRYRRIEQVKFGNNRTVTWTVTRFQIRDAKKAAL